VVVGIIDQSHEEDQYCLEAYCKEMGSDIYRKIQLRQDTTKVISKPTRHECPRVDQIRKLSVHNVAAKGPTWARALVHKILGDEEFCLQIDAHTEFVQDWDEISKREWAATGNEFAVISTVPAGLADKNEDVHTVPRQCEVQFLEVGVPFFNARGDGKVENLEKPLLSHGWSAGFSFAKCHLEESAPYDPFTPYTVGVEQFARFARFWTRGYDVYTPTQNIVYHNYQPNPDGHGLMEWMKPRRERLRTASVQRVKSYLGLPGGLEGLRLDNLGIYGLGKRRTLQQMSEFMELDLEAQKSRPLSLPCGKQAWVPYDANISPMENLFDKPDDLDPQPEYPLRKKMTFYKKEIQPPSPEVLEGDVASDTPVIRSAFPSTSMLLSLWILGLIMWCMAFMPTSSSSRKRPRQKRVQKAMKSV